MSEEFGKTLDKYKKYTMMCKTKKEKPISLNEFIKNGGLNK